MTPQMADPCLCGSRAVCKACGWLWQAGWRRPEQYLTSPRSFLFFKNGGAYANSQSAKRACNVGEEVVAVTSSRPGSQPGSHKPQDPSQAPNQAPSSGSQPRLPAKLPAKLLAWLAITVSQPCSQPRVPAKTSSQLPKITRRRHANASFFCQRVHFFFCC